MAQLLQILYNMKAAERTVAFLKGDDVPALPLIESIVEIVIEIIVIVSAVKLLWPSSPVNTPEPESVPTEKTAPAELPPPGLEPAAG